MEWIKAIPGAVYDQGTEIIARHPVATFWVVIGLVVIALVW